MENCIFCICNNAMGERRELNPRMVDSREPGPRARRGAQETGERNIRKLMGEGRKALYAGRITCKVASPQKATRGGDFLKPATGRGTSGGDYRETRHPKQAPVAVIFVKPATGACYQKRSPQKATSGTDYRETRHRKLAPVAVIFLKPATGECYRT
ncbi:hypothetical protein BRADI_5g08626v3 [Brachypodium distachyon]|uniref:Uncharacterized protein n=1 Tax=Brachypodium distachyon TaxID=15368 RepID=A0A0Q3KQU4_BRADI|nr:hypothetical protein BRADI_5g08626v3 [Brachypodium distachyon]